MAAIPPHAYRHSGGNLDRQSVSQGLTQETGERGAERKDGNDIMWTIVMVLLALWLLGIVSSYTLGGLLHLLLVVAAVMVLVRLVQGRGAA